MVIKIFRNPDRYEEGIATDTIASMKVKKNNSKNKPKETEVWLMYKINNPLRRKPTDKKTKSKILMISTWIYPGRTKKGDSIPIPEEILAELETILYD